MLDNFSVVQDLAKQLIQPRPCHYISQDLWKHIEDKQKYKYQHLETPQINSRSIGLHLIQPTQSYIKRIEPQVSSTCIIYLHGLSSYCMEGSFVIDNLKHFDQLNISVCLYDLRGHGKDKAKTITFAMEESKELYQIITFLYQQKNFKQFILWGRSMGATTILKMLIDYQQQLNRQKIQILQLILDSPFSSFQKVASNLITRQTGIPRIFSKGIFEYLLKTIQRKHNLKINVQIKGLPDLKIPVIFLYSLKDQMVSCQHTQFLFQKYKYSKKEKIQVVVGHNQKRPQTIIDSIFARLAKQLNSRIVLRKKSVSMRKSGLFITTSKCITTKVIPTTDKQTDYQSISVNNSKVQTKSSNKKFKIYSSQIIQKYNINKQNCNKSNGKDRSTSINEQLCKIKNQNQSIINLSRNVSISNISQSINTQNHNDQYNRKITLNSILEEKRKLIDYQEVQSRYIRINHNENDFKKPKSSIMNQSSLLNNPINKQSYKKQKIMNEQNMKSSYLNINDIKIGVPQFQKQNYEATSILHSTKNISDKSSKTCNLIPSQMTVHNYYQNLERTNSKQISFFQSNKLQASNKQTINKVSKIKISKANQQKSHKNNGNQSTNKQISESIIKQRTNFNNNNQISRKMVNKMISGPIHMNNSSSKYNIHTSNNSYNFNYEYSNNQGSKMATQIKFTNPMKSSVLYPSNSSNLNINKPRPSTYKLSNAFYM